MSLSQSLWVRGALFALSIFLLSFVYIYAYVGAVNIVLLSELTAFTGGILIGCSFALSGMSYFFNFLDSKLRYRKEIGIMGYFFALTHVFTVFIRFPDIYIKNFPFWMTKPDAILGMIAMFILTYMTYISTDFGMRQAGMYFRPLLRTGYIAYALLIIRAYLLQHQTWEKWFSNLETLPRHHA